MNVSITHYDDITTQNEVITMYVVNVQYSTRASYTLAKRYSDFATLYQVVKEALPADYKFPNKSLFHNNAQFTKERRLKGFDELLKLLAKHQPFDPNFQAFLEMKQHISPSDREAIAEQMRTRATESNSSKTLPIGLVDNGVASSGGSANRRATIKSVSLKSKIDLHADPSKDAEVRQKLSRLSNYLYQKVHEEEEQLSPYELAIQENENNFRHHFHREAPKLLLKTLKKAGITYAIMTVLGIIDLFHCQFSRTFYSFTYLCMIMLFIDLKKIRKGLPNYQDPLLVNNPQKKVKTRAIKKKSKTQLPIKSALKQVDTEIPAEKNTSAIRKRVTMKVD